MAVLEFLFVSPLLGMAICLGIGVASFGTQGDLLPAVGSAAAGVLAALVAWLVVIAAGISVERRTEPPIGRRLTSMFLAVPHVVGPLVTYVLAPL